MPMYNFDFIDSKKDRPLETRNQMLPSLRAARNHYESLFYNYGKTIDAVHENGGTKGLYEWPET
jgi:hypothetical protein